MYLGEPLQYYQSSNNLPQTAQTLDSLPMVTANSFNMVDHHQQLQKEYNIYSCHGVALLVLDLFPPSVANTAYFESLCSLFTFVSVSILNLALFCSTLPVALLVVDLSPPQSCFVLLNASSRSARRLSHSWLVSVLPSQSFLTNSQHGYHSLKTI